MLAETQSVGQIVWARYAIALPVIVLLTPRAEWRGLFRTENSLHQIARGLIPIGVSVAMVLAVRYLPLAEATVILFAAPFLVVALAGPILGEHVRPASWIGVAVGFAAVLIVARPGFSDVSYYALFPLAAAVFYALYQLVTRGLTNKGERPRTTLVWTLATGAVVATPLAAAHLGAGLDHGLGAHGVARTGLRSRAVPRWSRPSLTRRRACWRPSPMPRSWRRPLSALSSLTPCPTLWTLLGVAMIVGAGVLPGAIAASLTFASGNDIFGGRTGP